MITLADITTPEWTHENIVARINERRKMDPVGVECNELVIRLPWEYARPYLMPNINQADWDSKYEPLVREDVFALMRNYHPFAWKKANGKNAIASCRSVMHYMAWCWQIGDMEFCEELWHMGRKHYHCYGKPCLRMVAERYGWDWSAFDDGAWLFEREGAAHQPDEAMAMVLARLINVELK
jgi:hypothetical protein